jgi:hypothetical protein
VPPGLAPPPVVSPTSTARFNACRSQASSSPPEKFRREARIPGALTSMPPGLPGDAGGAMVNRGALASSAMRPSPIVPRQLKWVSSGEFAVGDLVVTRDQYIAHVAVRAEQMAASPSGLQITTR